MVAVGLEEISARLNLMVKAELAELVAGAPMNPGDPETRCQYLEKLLGKSIRSRNFHSGFVRFAGAFSQRSIKYSEKRILGRRINLFEN